MPIATHTLSNYADRRQDDIAGDEGEILWPYVDPKGGPSKLANRVVQTGILLWALSGLAGASDRPVLKAKWLPECSKNAQPYFSVDVFEDGAVRYQGGDQARERGDLTTQLEPQEFEQLKRAAIAAERGSARLAYKKSDDDAPNYCLEIVRWEKDRGRSIRGAATQLRMRSVISAFDHLFTANHWVCPARVSLESTHRAHLSRTLICKDAQNLAIDLAKFDELSCISHRIEVYPDTVHYVVLRPTIRSGHIGLPNSLVAESYHTITSEEFQRLMRGVKALDLHQEDIYEGTPLAGQGSYVNRNNYFTSDPADFEGIKDSVLKVANLDWIELPRGTQRCSTTREHTTVLLRYEYAAIDK